MMLRFVFILAVSCIFNYCFAQSMSFSRVGCVGSLADGGYVASLPVSFNSVADCIKLNTGVSLFGSTLGHKEFVVFCKPVSADENLEIQLYPNPVVSYTRLVATGVDLSLSQVNLTIVDAAGRVVWREKVYGTALRTGYVLKIGHFSAGNYFLRVDAWGLIR